ncbi:MAG: GTP cyclohydrolase II [Shimia sp.]
MSLLPSPRELRARARADLRLGLPVAVDGALVLAAEALRPDRFAALAALGRPVLALSDWRARTLKARVYDDGVARIVLPEGADCRWVAAVADPALDLEAPLKGPFEVARVGDAAPHRAAIALAKEARLLPAALVLEGAPIPEGITRLTGAALERGVYGEVVSARLPMRASEAGRVHVYRPDDGSEEHYAIEIGRPDRSAPVLARLHSACFTGDVLGSLKCDCGPQLDAALAAMGAAGAGVLLYLNQEGRGIGLANKMRAYALQDQGFDTVEANHRLGFEDDERDFRIGADLLRLLGFGAVRLMTNNPAKVARMEGQGIRVAERVPLAVGRTAQNAHYLAVKASKSGHLL